MASLQCVGWWEQDGYGRQPMDDLQLSFSNGSLRGTGSDIVGDFQLNGFLKEDRIYLLKRYIGAHRIEYNGESVGEGTYKGFWSCSGLTGGKWFIAVKRSATPSIGYTADVQEIGNKNGSENF